MPASLEDIQKIIRDPRFSEMSNNPEAQVRVIQDYLYRSDERFPTLNLDEQIGTAAEVLDKARPGIASRFADALPIIGPIKQAIENPDAVRPLTRGVLKAIGGEGILSTGLGRGLAEAGREVVEGAALIPVGGFIAKPLTALAGKVLGGVAAKTLGGVAIESATTGAAEVAAPLAKAFASRAFIEQAVDRAVTDGTIGALYGAVSAAEHGDNPLNHLGESALYGAALGVAFMGFGVAARRFGEFRARQAVELLQTNPEMQTILKDAAPILHAFSKTAKVGREEAGDVIYRALQGTVREEEFPLLREMMLDNPRLLKTDMGLKIMQNQKELLLPKVLDESFPRLEIRVEQGDGRIYTAVDPTPSGIKDLLEKSNTGEIHVLDAKGHGATQFIGRVTEGLDARPLEGPEFGENPVLRPSGAYPERPSTFSDTRPRVEETPNPLTGEGASSTQAPPNQGGAPPEINPLTGERVLAANEPELSATFSKAITGGTLSESESAQLSQTVSEMVREQIASSLPSELRATDLSNPLTGEGVASRTPLPQGGASPIINPLTGETGVVRGLFLGDAERSSYGRYPQVVDIVQEAKANGRAITTVEIADALDVNVNQASRLYRELVKNGRIDRRGNPLETVTPVVPREPAKRSISNPGSPASIPGTSEIGTVVQDTPALKIVEKANGEQVSVVELATGEEAIMVKRPGLADAPLLSGAEEAEMLRAIRAGNESRAIAERLTTPEGRQAFVEGTELERLIQNRALRGISPHEIAYQLRDKLPFGGENNVLMIREAVERVRAATPFGEKLYNAQEVTRLADSIAGQIEKSPLRITEMTPQQRLSALERLERKMSEGTITNSERRSIQALRQYETTGYLDPRFANVRCRP